MTEARRLPRERIAHLSLVERIDVEIIEKLRPVLQAPAVKQLGKLGNVGDEPPLMAISLGLLAGGIVARKPALQRAAVRMVLAHLIAIGLKEWGKNNIDRTRPEKQLQSGSYHMAKGTSRAANLRSFPSGHTAGTLAIARAFSRDYPRHTKPVLAAAAVVGALQIPRGAHYPGDVVAGGAAGAVAEKIADFVIRIVGLRPKGKKLVVRK